RIHRQGLRDVRRPIATVVQDDDLAVGRAGRDRSLKTAARRRLVRTVAGVVSCYREEDARHLRRGARCDKHTDNNSDYEMKRDSPHRTPPFEVAYRLLWRSTPYRVAGEIAILPGAARARRHGRRPSPGATRHPLPASRGEGRSPFGRSHGDEILLPLPREKVPRSGGGGSRWLGSR